MANIQKQFQNIPVPKAIQIRGAKVHNLIERFRLVISQLKKLMQVMLTFFPSLN